MGKKITKVAKGIAYGDVSNISIRNILTVISRQMFNKITDKYFEDMRKYFNNKCPYTGKDLDDLEKNGLLATDHIVPQNREYCGLNVEGNLILVDKNANQLKGNKSLEVFLIIENKLNLDSKTKQERYDKIIAFQKKYNYDSEKIRNTISQILNRIYSNIRETQVKYVEEISKTLAGIGFANLSTKEFIPDSERKIGSIVKNEFTEILVNGLVPATEIINLCNPEYTNKTFGISSFPVLSKSKIEAKGSRTYAKPIVIRGEEYYLCNDWHEKSRSKLIEYINKYYN